MYVFMCVWETGLCCQTADEYETASYEQETKKNWIIFPGRELIDV